MSLWKIRRSFLSRVKNFSIFAAVLFSSIFVASLLKQKPNSSKIEKPKQKEPQVAIPQLEQNIEIDQVSRFFIKGPRKLPIVDTITYAPYVSWLKGKPAWIVDYASHYNTSRHFIARSLNNNKLDYVSQKVSAGDTFNVLSSDKNLEFYLLIDLQECTMDFYYLDLDKDERTFLKRYSVGLGRLDKSSPSGSLTPTGKFRLGEKVAVYKPGVEHYFQNQRTHMITVFGTRWLPFGEEIANCTASSKGYGLHGVPWVYNEKTDEWVEEANDIGNHTSDGCVRLSQKDIEEIFSIVITKPTIVEIVKSRKDAKLPMHKEYHLEG